MILYDTDGNAINCEKDQVKILKDAGFTVDKPEVKTVDIQKQGDSVFVELSEEEFDKLTIKEKDVYLKAKKAAGK